MKTEPREKEKLIEILEVEISNCQDDLDAASWAYEEGVLISKREAVALLDLVKSSPKIKRLEWEFCRLYYVVKTPIGVYTIRLDEYPFMEDDSTCSLYHNGGFMDEFVSVDEAKSAAQADFEKRVKECLDL